MRTDPERWIHKVEVSLRFRHILFLKDGDSTLLKLIILLSQGMGRISREVPVASFWNSWFLVVGRYSSLNCLLDVSTRGPRSTGLRSTIDANLLRTQRRSAQTRFTWGELGESCDPATVRSTAGSSHLLSAWHACCHTACVGSTALGISLRRENSLLSSSSRWRLWGHNSRCFWNSDFKVAVRLKENILFVSHIFFWGELRSSLITETLMTYSFECFWR